MTCKVSFNGTEIDVSEFIQTQEEYDLITDIFKLVNGIKLPEDRINKNEL